MRKPYLTAAANSFPTADRKTIMFAGDRVPTASRPHPIKKEVIMKTTTLRITLVLLALLLALPMAIACQKEPDTQEGTDVDSSNGQTAGQEEEITKTPWEDVLKEQAPSFNNNYPTLRLLTIDSEFNYSADSISGEDQAQHKRDNVLYETYGFEVEISHTTMGGIQKTIENLGLTGGAVPHMVIASASSLMPIAIAGTLQNLNAVDTIDFSSGYWVDTYTNNCAWDGKLYVAPTYSSRLFYHGPMALMYNTEIAKELQINDLYNLVDSGNWTLEKLGEYAAMAHLTDGSTGETTRYGLNALSGNGLLCGLYGAIGGTFSTMDADGNIQVDFSGADVNARLKAISNILHAEYAHVETWNDDIASFADGKDLFWYSSTGNFFSGKITGNQNLKYGVLPLPKYNTEQTDYITTVNTTSNFFTCIIKNWSGEDLRFAGYITELYNYLSYKILRPAKFDILMKYQVAQSGDDLRMIEIIFDTLYYDHNAVYRFAGTTTAMGNALASNETDNFTSTFNEKFRSKIAEAIGQYLGL